MTGRQLWKYLRYVYRHKRRVWQHGRALGCSRWRLAMHDWSKLHPAELMPYIEWFAAKDPDRKPAFKRAFLRHSRRNPHHWEYWCLPGRYGKAHDPLPIEHEYVLEMIADWKAMADHYGHPHDAWYRKHRADIHLHPVTRAWVEQLLGV